MDGERVIALPTVTGEPNTNDRDVAAVSRVLRGDNEAYRVLVEAYEPLVRRLAMKYLARSEDAEDAVQEIFVKAYRSLSSFRLDRRFLPWLYSVALNHLKTVYGKTRRIHDYETHHEVEPSGDMGAGSEDPARIVAQRAAAEEIRRAVHRLPESLRDVVVLYYLQEASVEDVQEALGLGRENVKSRLHRARKELRKLLDPDATDDR
jgi:RNA polymerase sigma-70 factor (ECF subfamily)